MTKGIRPTRTEGTVTQMDSRLEWHPTEAEVQAIIEELRPVLAAMAERQSHQMTERPKPSRST
jgi:hypothetical protein